MLSVRAWAAVLLSIAAIALGMAWIAEHVEGLPPCELCLIERIPWRIVFGLGLVAILCGNRIGAVLNSLTVPVLLFGVVLSVIHVGVEVKWWESPFPACHAPKFHAGSFSQHMAALPLRPLKPCDAPTFLFDLPVSMAFLGGVAFLVTFLYAIYWSIKYFATPRRRFRHSAAFR